jgi:hypothetical protein
MTLLPALARASAVRGISFTLFLSPKAFVPVVGILMGPPVAVGMGPSRELGVIGLVIIGACGRFGWVMTGRFVGALVATSPWGGAGGLVAREGITELPAVP